MGAKRHKSLVLINLLTYQRRDLNLVNQKFVQIGQSVGSYSNHVIYLSTILDLKNIIILTFRLFA